MPQENLMNSFSSVFGFLKPYRGKMFASFLLLIASSMMILIQPRITQWAIDIGIPSGNITYIIGYALAITVSALLSLFVNYSSGVLLIQASQYMSYDLRNALFKKISSFSFKDFDSWRTGELIVRTNSDVNTVRMFIRMGFFMLIQSVLMLAGSLISMFTINTSMALIMAILMPSIIILFFVIAKFIRPIFMKVRQALDQVNNTLQENLVGAKLVRAFSRQQEEERKFETKNRDYYKISKNVSMIMGVLMPLLMMLGNLAVVIVLYSGGKQVADPAVQMSLGSLVAFSNYTMTAFFPLIMLGMILSFLAMAMASVKRINEILETDPSIKDTEKALVFDTLKGAIEFNHVSHRYGEGEPVLRDFNLSIKPGERLGIIGTTGSGKSSLVHLIPRFYDTSSGTVKVDGFDVKDLSLNTLRSRITVALQDTQLFSGTLAYNIRFGKPDATDEEVKQAALIACAHEFIDELEDGYQHQIGERGQGLSGGQRQRLAIARAVLSDPDILILDDVTSSLDTVTESSIVSNLYNESRKRTTIIISQKINTIKRADRILVLDQGQIISIGTHEELLKSCEIYQDIFETQNPAV